jgi:3-hydroxymyristoyl/3-hydroxydecanoyl-(acyl carrier protein) dehydratase
MTVVDPIVRSERVDADEAAIELEVPRDLDYFDGHFPGAPVVPGVVLIKWALALARRRLGVAGVFAGVEALKFQHVVRPGAAVTLELKYAEAAGKLHFSFRAGQQRCSSGRVLLRAES